MENGKLIVDDGQKDILLAENIYAAYYKKEVLNGVSISVKEGEIVALIGPNGAGKSTLLKVIIGFLKPKGGRVVFDNKEITYNEPYLRVRNGIGYFIQGGEVFKNMTVDENLEIGMMRSQKLEVGDEKFNVENRKEEVYTLFPNLKEKKRSQASLLSGGEKQALALGMILMTGPKLLLLDEPSAGLSPAFVKEMLNKIVAINKTKKIAILIVEQNVREVLNIAQRVYLMKLGKIFMETEPEKLSKGEILEQAFLK